MDRHIHDKGADMYTRALSRVERILLSGCDIMADTLDDLKVSVGEDMWHAYSASVVAKEDGNRVTREELHRLLVEADGQFQLS